LYIHRLKNLDEIKMPLLASQIWETCPPAPPDFNQWRSLAHPKLNHIVKEGWRRPWLDGRKLFVLKVAKCGLQAVSWRRNGDNRSHCSYTIDA
jgi:hypothetical protein